MMSVLLTVFDNPADDGDGEGSEVSSACINGSTENACRQIDNLYALARLLEVGVEDILCHKHDNTD